MKESRRNGVLCMFALACVAILLATTMVAVVGNNNSMSSTDSNGKLVTYEGLCGVANDDGNIRSDSNTRVDSNGFVISVCDGNDDFIGESERAGECSESNGGTFWCNNLKYEIYPGDRVKVVNYDSDYGKIRSFSVPDYIDRNGTRYTVTEIDEWAMTSRLPVGVWVPLHVEIGPEIVRIRDDAFSGQLEFLRDTLKTFTIRNIDQSKLVEICDSAFFNTSIETIELPQSLQLIRQDAFGSTKNLNSVVLHSDTLDIHKKAFNESSLKQINLEKVRYIGEEAFNKVNLKEIDLSSAEEICCSAFCTDTLTSVKFSLNLVSLDDEAFYVSRKLLECDTYHFYDTHGNELGQCAQLMAGKTFVMGASAGKLTQVL